MFRLKLNILFIFDVNLLFLSFDVLLLLKSLSISLYQRERYPDTSRSLSGAAPLTMISHRAGFVI